MTNLNSLLASVLIYSQFSAVMKQQYSEHTCKDAKKCHPQNYHQCKSSLDSSLLETAGLLVVFLYTILRKTSYLLNYLASTLSQLQFLRM